MLISDKDAQDKLNSPHNLLNRLRRGDGLGSRDRAMSLFGIGVNKPAASQQSNQPSQVIPFTPSTSQQPTTQESDDEVGIDDIMNNADSRIKMETAHNEALDAMVDSIKQVRLKLPSVENPVKAADIAAKMSKIVDNIRSERLNLAKQDGDRHVHLHLYSPEQKKLDDFKTIDV